VGEALRIQAFAAWTLLAGLASIAFYSTLSAIYTSLPEEVYFNVTRETVAAIVPVAGGRLDVSLYSPIAVGEYRVVVEAGGSCGNPSITVEVNGLTMRGTGRVEVDAEAHYPILLIVVHVGFPESCSPRSVAGSWVVIDARRTG